MHININNSGHHTTIFTHGVEISQINPEKTHNWIITTHKNYTNETGISWFTNLLYPKRMSLKEEMIKREWLAEPLVACTFLDVPFVTVNKPLDSLEHSSLNVMHLRLNLA